MFAISWSPDPMVPEMTTRGIHGAELSFRVVSAGHTASTISAGSISDETHVTRLPNLKPDQDPRGETQ
jgi:hypothetical protein